jgi:hypothetical protein
VNIPESPQYIASLPWYDHDKTRLALDQFWHAVAQYLQSHGIDGLPPELQRLVDIKSQWRSCGLILSQCCGPDLFTPEGAGLEVIARPSFADLSCEAGCYYSVIVGNLTKPHGPVRAAVNSLSSRSGHFALRDWLQSSGIEISSVQVSGSHMDSLRMLAQKQADIAAIDAHTINQYQLSIDLPVLGISEPAPAPPFVCHRDSGIDSGLLSDALTHAVEVRGEAIGVTGLVAADRADFSHMQDAN